MTSTRPVVLHPDIVSPTRIFQHWNTHQVAHRLAGLGLILAFGLLTLAIAKALDATGVEAMQASIQQPNSSSDTSVPTGDGEDEEAFPSLLTTATITSLVSYLTLPYVTGLSFYHPPLLQPPQPGLRR